jgi:hypothetical protein
MTVAFVKETSMWDPPALMAARGLSHLRGAV